MRDIGIYGKDKRLDAQRIIAEVAILIIHARNDLSILVQVIE